MNVFDRPDKRSRIVFDANQLLVAGLAALIVVFVIGGALGLLSLKSSFDDTRRFIEAVDAARASQVDFQKQFYLWKSMVLSHGDESAYRSNAFLFSFQADRVRDRLFNLKIVCADFPGIAEKIEALRRDHASLTAANYALSEAMKGMPGVRRTEEIATSGRGDDALLRRMDEVVLDVERHADEEIARIGRSSFLAAMVSLGCIAIIAAALSVMIARRLMRAHDTLDGLVRERTRDLEEANELLRGEIEERRKTGEMLMRATREAEDSRRQIAISEQKYRRLVEDSRDIIFSLDAGHRVTSVNRAVADHLGVRPGDVVGASFADVLWADGRNATLSRDLILRRLASGRPDDWPLQFTAEFRSPRYGESKVMNVKLERVDRGGAWEVLGKMSAPPEDELARSLVFERQKYVIGNSLMKIEELSFRLTRNLSGFLAAEEITMVRFALREMMINAIEHGNLNISYAEKTAASAGSDYLDFVMRRRRDERYAGRRVLIEYAVSRARVMYRITDDGDGFDYAGFLAGDPNAANDNMLAHGRGISIARQIFDDLRYEGRGNRVVMVKRLAGEAEEGDRGRTIGVVREGVFVK